MQSLSKEQLTDMLSFVEHQILFIGSSTRNIHTYHDFLLSESGMVLFNSTCMCLQTIGETIRKVENYTQGKLFSLYPEIPWKRVIRMRNIISHDYLSVDVELVYSVVQEELEPLLQTLRQILSDIEQGKRDAELNA